MDTALKTRPFPSYTAKELEGFIAAGRDAEGRMAAEVARRQKVEAGDFSVMFPSERLRFVERAR